GAPDGLVLPVDGPHAATTDARATTMERRLTCILPAAGPRAARRPSTFCSLHLASPPNAGSKGTRMTTVRAALVQCAWTGDKDSMLQQHVRYIAEAARHGAKIISLQ